MSYLSNVFVLIFVCGIIALIVVGILYLSQRKKIKSSVNPTMMESSPEVIKQADELVSLNADSLKA